MGVAAAVVLALAAGGYFLFQKFIAPPPPPPVVAKPKPAGTPATPSAQVATKPATPAPAPAPLTASDTLNAVAHAPVNAINKAHDAVNAVRAGEQARVDAATVAEEAPDRKAAAKSVQTSSPIAPGISATNANVEAVSEATPAFRSFVATAKITGVFQGEPARVYLNGRLARAGDIVDSALGITFEGIDSEKKLILFKDKSGATVTRRY